MRSRLFLTFMVISILCACGGEQPEQTKSAAPVRVAEARRSAISRNLHAVGNVRASATVGIVPRVAGEILAVRFTEGQEVKAGQPLIQIDPRPYEAVLREKRGQLAKSEAQLAKSLDDRRRYGKLATSGYVSREAYEQTATDAAAMRATVQSDKAAVESAALDLAYCTISAPISGRIGMLNVDKGNMVKSGDNSPIVQIDTIAPCYISFSVPEGNLAAILEHLKKGAIPIMATPTGGLPENGELTLVDNTVDTKTGTIKLRGVFQNSDRHLWPGQFVEISIPLGEVENALVIPSRALQSGRDESYVYVVDDEGRAQYKKVGVLFESSGKSAVSGDLEPGEKVVVEGQVRLAPGVPVNILN